jgi:hypothetical protein
MRAVGRSLLVTLEQTVKAGVVIGPYAAWPKSGRERMGLGFFQERWHN